MKGYMTDKTIETISLHKKGNTIPEIVKKLSEKYDKVTYAGVALRLSRNNISANRSEMPRRTTLNEDYFSSISSNNVAYFLGLMGADGGVCDKINRVRLSLQSTDGYLIEFFKKEVNFSGILCRHKQKNKCKQEQTAIQLYSKKMVSDLINLGCTPRKSLTLELPRVPKKYFGSFLRGYFDGDGSIGYIEKGKYLSFKLTGSIPFMNELKLVLEKEYGIKSFILLRGGGVYCDLKVHKQIEISKIRDIMYEFDEVSMKRKKEKFFSDLSYENVGHQKRRKRNTVCSLLKIAC